MAAMAGGMPSSAFATRSSKARWEISITLQDTGARPGGRRSRQATGCGHYPSGVDADSLLVRLDPDQRRAVTHPSNPLCIRAGAGSGKTRVLTRRIAWRAITGDAD